MLDRAMKDVAAIFLPMIRDWPGMARQYSDDQLALIVDFYRQMELRAHLLRLREAPAAEPPAAEPARHRRSGWLESQVG